MLTRMSYAQPTQKELARPYYTFHPGSQEASVVPHHSLATEFEGEPITRSCTAPELILMPQRGPGGLAFDQLSPLMTAGMQKKKNPTKSRSVIITKGLESM